MIHQFFLDLPPMRHVNGVVRLPGSKSISNRALLLAGLSEGTTVLLGVLDADDTRVMRAALTALGCVIKLVGEAEATALHVTGLGGKLSVKSASLFLGNAGTAMRPLTAALAVLAATQGGTFELHGTPRMHERPIGDLVAALRKLGCTVDDLGVAGCPPLRVRSVSSNAGNLSALALSAPIQVRGDVSSQFLTALLLALPLVAAQSDIVIEVTGTLISKPYVEITLALLERFGVHVKRDGWERFTIPAGSRYQSAGRFQIESDASSASYFIGLGAIAASDGRALRIEGLGLDSIQGDIRFVDAARAMGARIDSGPNWLEVRRGDVGNGWPLHAIELDCNHMPDAAMTLAVIALYADGPTRLTNIASWRVKETDRLAAMAAELRKLGAMVVEGEDFLEIHPPARWSAASIRTYDDHRVAMCFSLAAFNPVAENGPLVPVRILDPHCVAKTFPTYFNTLFSVAEADIADIPVITIDGPTASGKGTLANALAHMLGYHYLDSGALYRATALAALQRHVDFGDEAKLAQIASTLALRFHGDAIWLGSDNVTLALRHEDIGATASRISALPAVRAALLNLQLGFRRLPGLVADGRDMGSVVFPAARLKVYLTASADQRAERRYKQLISKGFSANIESLRGDLVARDARDQTRAAAPLRAAQDALLLDNSGLSIDASVDLVLAWWAERSPFG